jgi:biopolymer transport protein ExbB/TolQ
MESKFGLVNVWLQGDSRTELHDTLDASDWVTSALRNSIDDTTSRMQSGLAILASVGSTAPFVGLFGTVWGIYHALMASAPPARPPSTRWPARSARR